MQQFFFLPCSICCIVTGGPFCPYFPFWRYTELLRYHCLLPVIRNYYFRFGYNLPSMAQAKTCRWTFLFKFTFYICCSQLEQSSMWSNTVFLEMLQLLLSGWTEKSRNYFVIWNYVLKKKTLELQKSGGDKKKDWTGFCYS